MREGDPATASDLLGAALAMWRGSALADIQVGSRLEIQQTRLNEMRVGALEQRIEADMLLGRHRDILGELAALSVEHSLNETVHAQLILALYRSGRRSQALSAFHRLRGSLLDQLGLEPSPMVQRLQHAILTADPGIELVERPRSPDRFGIRAYG